MAIDSGILNYQGNAAQAGGYGPNGIPVGTGADSGNMVNAALNNLMAQNAQRNMVNYAQKVKDRDTIFTAISNNEIPVEVDTIYRPALEKQRDMIKEMAIKDPGYMNSYKGKIDLQEKSKKFLQDANIAKTNSATLKALKLDYANNTDPQYRRRLEEFIGNEIGKSTNNPDYLIGPYQKMQDWSNKLFFTPDSTSKTKQLGAKAVTENGINYKEITEGSDLSQWDAFYNPYNFVNGEYKSLPDEAAAFKRDSEQDKYFNSPAFLESANSKLDSINKANGLTPDNARYLKPIATDNGDGTWNIEPDPVYRAKVVSLFNNYELPKTRREVDKDVMSARKTIADINQSNASAESSRASASEKYWNIKEAKELLPLKKAKMQSEINKADREGREDMSKAYGAANRIVGLVDETIKRGTFNKIKDKSITDYLGVSEEAEITEVNPNNKLGKSLFYQPVYSALDPSKVESKRQPQKVYMVRDGNDVKFVGIGAGENLLNAEILDIKEAPTKLIQSDNNWSLTDNDNKAIGLSFQIMQDNFSNGTESVQETQVTAQPQSGEPAIGTTATGPGGKKLVYTANGWVPQ